MNKLDFWKQFPAKQDIVFTDKFTGKQYTGHITCAINDPAGDLIIYIEKTPYPVHVESVIEFV